MPSILLNVPKLEGALVKLSWNIKRKSKSGISPQEASDMYCTFDNIACYSNEYVSGGGPYSADTHEHNNDDSNGFAIVINGHSLVHCLHPKLEEK